MDPAVFLRSRLAAAGWVAAPLCLMVAVYQGARLYCEAVEHRLAGDRAMMEIMPDLLNGLHRARNTLEQFTLGSGGAPVSEEISVFLTENSSYLGFRQDGVQITTRPGKDAAQPTEITVRLEGSGSLVSVLRFLEALQHPRYLVTVENAEIQLSARPDTDRSYQARLVLRYVDVRPPATP